MNSVPNLLICVFVCVLDKLLLSLRLLLVPCLFHLSPFCYTGRSRHSDNVPILRIPIELPLKHSYISLAIVPPTEVWALAHRLHGKFRRKFKLLAGIGINVEGRFVSRFRLGWFFEGFVLDRRK